MSGTSIVSGAGAQGAATPETIGASADVYPPVAVSRNFVTLVYRVAVVGGIVAVASFSLIMVRRDAGRRGGWAQRALVVTTVLGLLLTSASVAGAVWNGYSLRKVIDSAKKVDVPSIRPQGQRPPLGPVNFLVLGTDQRDPNSTYGHGPDEPTSLDADVIMLVIIDPQQLRATVLSVPRDYFVVLPGRGPAKINSALAQGGPDLQVTVVQRLTGIAIDHYVEVDFKGFQRLVDEFGGITLNVGRYAMRDPAVGLDRPAGDGYFTGQQALDFVRSRNPQFLVNGEWRTDPEGDLGRIKRQQHFLEEMWKKARENYSVTNFSHYAELVGGGLTFDRSFDTRDLEQLLQSFAQPKATRPIDFKALPGVPDSINPDGKSCVTYPACYVFAKEPEADQMLVGLGGSPVPDEFLPFGRG